MASPSIKKTGRARGGLQARRLRSPLGAHMVAGLRAEDVNRNQNLSHNQNPVLNWSTQNHVKNQKGGAPRLFLVGTAPY